MGRGKVGSADSSISRRVVVAVIGNLAPPVSAIVTIPLLAHALGVVGRGEAAAVTAPFLLVTLAATVGLPEATTYFVARDRQNARTALRRGIVLTAIFGLLAAALVAGASTFLAGDSRAVSSLIALSAVAVVPTMLVALVRGAAAGLQQWTSITWERIVAALVRMTGLSTLYLTGHLDSASAAIVIVLAPISGGFVYFGLLRRSRIELAEGQPAAGYGATLGYGSRIWLGSISGIVLSRVDQALMTPLSDVGQLGLYAVAVSISELPLIVNWAFRDVIFAADSAQHNPSRLTFAARTASTACVLLALLLALSMPLWLTVVLGAEFESGTSVILLMLAAVALGTPGSVAGAGLSALGKPQLRSYSLLIACIPNVILVLILVPAYGAIGAGIASLVGNLVSSNLNIAFYCRSATARHFDFYVLRLRDFARLRGSLSRRPSRGGTI